MKITFHSDGTIRDAQGNSSHLRGSAYPMVPAGFDDMLQRMAYAYLAVHCPDADGVAGITLDFPSGDADSAIYVDNDGTLYRLIC
jgi:hypothetical protein